MKETRIQRMGEGHVEQGGDGTGSALTGVDVTERYVGPDAWWIASILSQPVRFEQGWFWTTAFCHSRRGEGLAFRQRPDGNGIDARCHTGGCSPELAADALGGQIGWPLRGPTAYEPLAEPVGRFSWLTHRPLRTMAMYGTAALTFAAPLLLGLGFQAAYLSYLGYCVGVGLMTWFLAPRPTGRPMR